MVFYKYIGHNCFWTCNQKKMIWDQNISLYADAMSNSLLEMDTSSKYLLELFGFFAAAGRQLAGHLCGSWTYTEWNNSKPIPQRTIEQNLLPN